MRRIAALLLPLALLQCSYKDRCDGGDFTCNFLLLPLFVRPAPCQGYGTLRTSFYGLYGGSGTESIRGVCAASDDGIVVTTGATADITSLQGMSPLRAYTASTDIMVIKLNRYGTVSWFTFLGGTGLDDAYALTESSDGGYVIAGTSTVDIPSMGGAGPLNAHAGSTDQFITKLDRNGNILWYTFLGGAGIDELRAITRTTDGGFVTAGSSNAAIASIESITPVLSYQGSTDCLLVKISASGRVQWYTLFGSGGGVDDGTSIGATADGGVAMAGNASGAIANIGGVTPIVTHNGGVGDVLAAKLTAAGSLEWFTLLGGGGTDQGQALAIGGDGSIGVGGFSSAAFVLLQGLSPVNAHSGGGQDLFYATLTSAGNVSNYTFLGAAGTDQLIAAAGHPSGGFVLAGFSSANIASVGSLTPLNTYSAAEEILAAHINASGALQWYTFFGSTGNERGFVAASSGDGGLLFTGSASANVATLSGQSPLNSYSAGTDGILIKTQSTGRL